jgi:hypothetical protein
MFCMHSCEKYQLFIKCELCFCCVFNAALNHIKKINLNIFGYLFKNSASAWLANDLNNNLRDLINHFLQLLVGNMSHYLARCTPWLVANYLFLNEKNMKKRQLINIKIFV